MMKRSNSYCFSLLLLFLVLGCVKPYEPAVITGTNAFLVVDGIINSGADVATTITLSRSRRLSDTTTFIPEQQSQIVIEDRNGARYPLQEKEAGIYVSAPLNLDPSGSYRLNITTAGENNYISDFVPVKQTPPIDSINWKQSGDTISIHLSTHDPKNATFYYRWEYEEDWEYNAVYDSNLAFRNGRVVFTDSAEQMHRCWKYRPSFDILLHSTRQLSQDLVAQEVILEMSAQSPKLEKRYSLLTRQFAMTKEAFEYWQILKKNTQQLGSLFDAQPSQLIGNIRNATKADEPVIGYISAAVERSNRLFIWRGEIINGYNPVTACKAFIIDPDSATVYLENPAYAPAYYVTGGGLAISTPPCVDCRLAGGTTVKPPFWP